MQRPGVWLVKFSIPTSCRKIGDIVMTPTLPIFRAALPLFFFGTRSQCWITREPPIEEMPT